MNFQSESPSGASLHPLGVFIIVSLLFVMGALIEFALILTLKQYLECKSILMVVPNCPATAEEIKRKLGEEQHNMPAQKGSSPSPKISRSIDQVDITALISFLLLYFIFNCAYWIDYLKV